MQRGRMLSILMVGFVWLSACGREPLPRLEPVREVSYAPGRGTLTLSADTNCVNAGEKVAFTLRVANTEQYPLRFVGNNLFDIVLRGASKPMYRWSDTDQYPHDINPVFAPGEVREYHWRWTADAAYGRDRHNPGVNAHAETGAMAPQDTVPQGNEVSIGVGVDYFGFQMSSVECAALRR